MTTTHAREAIAYLIDQAQQGHIDPWDVQVIEVIDRFLSEVGLMGGSLANQQKTDLPKSGQAFLWASMLVLLKADTLEKLESIEQEEAEIADSDVLVEENERSSLPKHLERQLKRRSSAPPIRRRKVTLQELIEQIKKIASELEQETDSSSYRRIRSTSRKEAVKAIAQLAHNENLTEVATRLEKFLAFDLPNLAPGQTDIDLERLLQWWTELSGTSQNQNQAHDRNQSHDRVGIFWALLLLSAQSKVELSQVEFYQDLKIKPLERTTN